MNRLDGKVAIITGAAQGMGASHVKGFIEEGAKVIATDLNKEKGEELVKDLGDDVIFIEHDVTKLDSWKNVVSEGIKKFGYINVLVNNAGVLGPIANTVELSVEDYKNVSAVNQDGVFFGMKTVLPMMENEGNGLIVTISSTAGIIATYGFSSLAYMSSKFAVRGMTKGTAIEYGEKNIRVNSVHPGFIMTEMMASATDEDGGEATEIIPLNRIAGVREMTNLVIFLASDESSFITGQEHIVDGGQTARA